MRAPDRALAAVLVACGAAVALAALAEGAVRLAGGKPFVNLGPRIVCRPPGAVVPTRTFLVGLHPGVYDVSIGELHYRVTHTPEGTRTTGPAKDPRLPEVAFVGCSMSYGMGVDDQLTYPYLLNAQAQGFRVVNLSVPGTGTLHAFLRLEQHFAQGHRPAVAVYNYLDFHDDRSVLGVQTRGMLNGARMGAEAESTPEVRALPWTYAYARRDGDTFDVREEDVWRASLVSRLSRVSAAANLLEQSLRRAAYDPGGAAEVTRMLLLKMDALCRRHGTRFYVTTMSRGPATAAIAAFCASRGIPAIDISVDFRDPTLTNQPWDYHPSAKAHAMMYERLKQELVVP